LNKKAYFGIVALLFFAVGVVVLAAVPADTIRTDAGGVSTIVVDYINVTGDYYWRNNNLTAAIEGFSTNVTNEWGLVYGITGDWFNYTDLTGVPVYIGLQIHPDNVTAGVLPQVYDKQATQWQLALYWYNGTQYAKPDMVLVMYHAHVDWDNPDGDTYIEANEEPA